MEIDLGHFMIREWRHGDEESLARHANNPKIFRNVRDRFPHPYTLEDARWWIEHNGSADPLTSFAIVVDGEAAGGIGFFLQEDILRRSVEIGYWLGEPFWGRGIVTDAVRAMSEHIFANFDVCRIFACVFEWNPGSMRVLEKAGFVFEGRMRKAVTKLGQTIDDFVYALVREES
jgi:[ribosomal protein S5]-alanine N-acetyltransferase